MFRIVINPSFLMSESACSILEVLGEAEEDAVSHRSQHTLLNTPW